MHVFPNPVTFCDSCAFYDDHENFYYEIFLTAANGTGLEITNYTAWQDHENFKTTKIGVAYTLFT